MKPNPDLFKIQYTNDDTIRSSNFDHELLEESQESIPSQFLHTHYSQQKKRNVALFICTIFLLFLIKLFFLQIVSGEHFASISEQNRLVSRVTSAERGVIIDRNGVIIAKNKPIFNLIGEGHLSKQSSDEIMSILFEIQEILPSVDIEYIRETIMSTESGEYILLENMDREDAFTFMSSTRSIDGIRVEEQNLRAYITDTVPSLSHVIGYTGGLTEEEYIKMESFGYRPFDRIGKGGIEKQYEKELRGIFGVDALEINARGIPQRIASSHDAEDGMDLTLTIDVALQSYIETVLQENLYGSEASRASVVALHPETGEVFALVSWPAFDANDFSQGIDVETYTSLIEDEDNPLFSRSISGELPSGSTIKTIYAAAALTEGIITPQTHFLSIGGLQVGPRFFPDWRAGGHGQTNVYHAIADSVNTFFYIIGGGNDTFDGMGVAMLMEYAKRFGLGGQTGIDLPNESDGFLPSKDWKEEVKGEQWFVGDTYNVSIGQGDVLVTPLQIAISTAVFANDGYLITPYLHKKASENQNRIISSEIASIVKDGMRRTVTKGSATSLQAAPVEVAGKTGTAQWSSVKTPHSWFTGFAPFEQPEFVITVVVEEGADESPAVPIVADILDWWFDENHDRGTIDVSAH